MDPFTLIMSALLAIIFFCLGRVSARKAASAPPQPLPQPKAICGCDHGLHQHDRASDKCHAEVKKWTGQNRDKKGELWDYYKFVRCDCRRYTGPIPAEEFLAQSLLPPIEGV
jgi:hypothetical protein